MGLEEDAYVVHVGRLGKALVKRGLVDEFGDCLDFGFSVNFSPVLETGERA